MKNILFIMLMAGMVFLMACGGKTNSSAANAEAKFVVSGMCEMCKEKIETCLKGIKGVSEATWNQENKETVVKFDNTQTTEQAIKEAVSKIGYDAGDVKANPEAYEKLPKCCKKSS